jgi:protein-arginine deiminase
VRRQNIPLMPIILKSVFFAAALLAVTCAGPTSKADRAGQDSLPMNVLIPNLDDDNGDGIPDGNGSPLPAGTDDDVLQVRVFDDARLPEGAAVRAGIAEPWASFARAFVLTDSPDGSRYVLPPVEVDRADINKRGVVLGIEATDFASPGRPPSIEVKVVFSTKDGRPLDEHRILCRVAPFLLSSCLDPVEAVQVVRTKGTEQFVGGLGPLVDAAGARLEIVEAAEIPEHDVWMQDAVEIGTATDGERVMHVALHGNRGRELDAIVARKLLGRDFGVVRKGTFRGRQAEWIDWYGNLEVSPPVTAHGREFMNGRAYAGTQGERTMHPEVIAFLEAQEAQTPVLWLDTSWLVIGHVDEIVSWIPSQEGTPFRMMIPSPRLAVEILKKAERDAPGGILNRGTRRKGDKPGESERPVAEALADQGLMAAQEFVQGKIDAVRRTLQMGLDVADEDILEIPVLFNSDSRWFPGRYFAETVNMVNGLLLGNVYIVPDPRGPLVDGADVFLQAIKDRLEPLGCRVVPLDCFDPYHRGGGEIHCGTNATRRGTVRKAKSKTTGDAKR